MPRPFGIAGVQFSPVPWDAVATVRKMTGLVAEVSAGFPWVQMILFPELSMAGEAPFVPPPTINTWRTSAQPVPGPFTDQLCEAARATSLWLVPGSMYERDGDDLYNTAIVISPEGNIIARYRKMFPWLPFESGIKAGESFCVFDVPDTGRFGLCICYDSWFPEVSRTLAWMGAEVILRPTLTATPDRPLELVLSQANAIFNQCYFVDVNMAGPWSRGHSMIVDPDGHVLRQADEGETILAEILDLELVRETRERGTLGLCQTWKQLRDFPGEFPPYSAGLQSGQIFRGLGDLQGEPHRPSGR